MRSHAMGEERLGCSDEESGSAAGPKHLVGKKT